MSCRYCGSLDHVPGDPETYCAEARTEYERATALIEMLIPVPLQVVYAPTGVTAMKYLDSAIGTHYAVDHAILN